MFRSVGIVLQNKECLSCCRCAAEFDGLDSLYAAPRRSLPGHYCGGTSGVHLLSAEQGLPGNVSYCLRLGKKSLVFIINECVKTSTQQRIIALYGN
jgi:hypothetical protein